MREFDYCFLGGTPKSGTSSIFNTLSTLGGVNFSTPKETFYFMEKGNPLINKMTNYHEHDYKGFETFFDRKSKLKRLEATSHLMYQLQMIEVVKDLDAKVVFVLRKPEDRIYSSFSFSKNNLGRVKRSLTFENYVQHLLKGEENSLKMWITNEQSRYVLQRELRYSTYATYLEPWLQTLRGNVKVMFFEDMLSNRERFYNEISDFFGLEFDHDQKYPAKNNVTSGIRNSTLHYGLSALRDAGLFKAKIFKPIKSIYNHIQKREKIKEPDVQKVKTELGSYFISHNDKLAKLLDVELPW